MHHRGVVVRSKKQKTSTFSAASCCCCVSRITTVRTALVYLQQSNISYATFGQPSLNEAQQQCLRLRGDFPQAASSSSKFRKSAANWNQCQTSKISQSERQKNRSSRLRSSRTSCHVCWPAAPLCEKHQDDDLSRLLSRRSLNGKHRGRSIRLPAEGPAAFCKPAKSIVVSSCCYGGCSVVIWSGGRVVR